MSPHNHTRKDKLQKTYLIYVLCHTCVKRPSTAANDSKKRQPPLRYPVSLAPQLQHAEREAARDYRVLVVGVDVVLAANGSHSRQVPPVNVCEMSMTLAACEHTHAQMQADTDTHPCRRPDTRLNPSSLSEPGVFPDKAWGRSPYQQNILRVINKILYSYDQMTESSSLK